MNTQAQPYNESTIWEYLHEVPDPEVPVIDVVELGIVRAVRISSAGTEISVTPTYSGCPATKTIEEDILAKLTEKGVHNPFIKTVLSPAWTTDWITESGKQKLKEYGIAPPEHTSADKLTLLTGAAKVVKCPHCNGTNTIMKSQFGSTSCKALYFCNDCQEPFDYFKCI